MLYNSLQRAVIANTAKYEKTYKTIWTELIKGVSNAQNGILVKYFQCLGIEHITDLAWLSYLQHYGCPTPMLDWTYDIQKALFFAADRARSDEDSSEIENYISVYVIHEPIALELSPKSDIQELFSPIGEKSHLNDSVIDKINQAIHDSLGDQMLGLVNEELKKRRRIRYFDRRIHKLFDVDMLASRNITFVSDRDNNPELSMRLLNSLNIVSQDGAFFFNPHPFAPLEWVLEKCVKPNCPDNEYDNCYSINIHIDLLPVLHGRITELGYSRRTIYPDPYEICATVAALSI